MVFRLNKSIGFLKRSCPWTTSCETEVYPVKLFLSFCPSFCLSVCLSVCLPQEYGLCTHPWWKFVAQLTTHTPPPRPPPLLSLFSPLSLLSPLPHFSFIPKKTTDSHSTRNSLQIFMMIGWETKLAKSNWR